jgi:hypothetical protein
LHEQNKHASSIRPLKNNFVRMKRQLFIFLLLAGTAGIQSQTVSDLFQQNDIRVTYLGIDYSHVKLIGNFSEFFEVGGKNIMELRDTYFPRWNMVVVNERDKYDLAGMLRKQDIYYDIDMISAVNSRTNLEGLVSLNTVKFTEEDISQFVSEYDFKGKEGIGVLFIAECLNKSAEEAIFHFVAMNMQTGDILFQRRLKGIPNGIGLRNYWINPLYRIINDVKFYYYQEWKQSAKPAGSQV